MAFTVIIKPSAEGNIRHYRVNEQRTIIDGIMTHLRDKPGTATKKKRQLRPNPIAPWELKIDIYRIFYNIDGSTVNIIAVGHKVHNKLYIQGKEVDL